MVEEIEGLSTKLECQVFMDGEVFEEREINVLPSRTMQCIPFEIAESSRSGNGVCRCVQTAVLGRSSLAGNRISAAGHLARVNEVRTL